MKVLVQWLIEWPRRLAGHLTWLAPLVARIVVGWVFLTIGLIVGTVWASQAPVSDPRVQAMQLQDPKIFVALVCWAVYSFELFAARRIGWGGRRTAYLSAIGFAIVLLNLVPISYFLTRSHNF